MRLIYISSYTFPSKHAEPYYVKSMAEGFVSRLGIDFSLVVRGDIVDDLKNTNALSVRMPSRMKTAWCLFWLPLHVYKNTLNNKEVVLMSNDPFIILVIILCKKIFRFRYQICSDWHQLYDDWKDSFLARNSDYLITTTKKLKQAIIHASGVSSERILVAYGGVHPDLFLQKAKEDKRALRERLGLPTDKFLVGYAGGFRSLGLEKGLDLMIKALRELDSRIVIVLVGGKGDDVKLYTELAATLGVADRCLVIPRKKFDVLVEYELAMDTLVIPYPNQHHFREYGFPMKVWEYMATGHPIIYSHLDIIAEVLHGRGTAFVPDDVADLARAISSVYTNYDAMTDVSNQNKIDVQEYTWKTRTEKICSFIQG